MPHPDLWGRLDKIMSPRVGDLAQKNYPRPNYPGGRPLGLHLIGPLLKCCTFERFVPHFRKKARPLKSGE